MFIFVDNNFNFCKRVYIIFNLIYEFLNFIIIFFYFNGWCLIRVLLFNKYFKVVKF